MKGFLEEVLDHVALQITQHERGRYWLREAYAGSVAPAGTVPAAGFLRTPPADTLVLLGFVRDQTHWNWIKTNGLYNLRAHGRRGGIGLGSKELACDLVVLSSRELDRTALARVAGSPEIHTIEEMRDLGYPEPHGAYFCLPVEFVSDEVWERLLTSERVEQARRDRGGVRGIPVVMSWLELAGRTARSA